MVWFKYERKEVTTHIIEVMAETQSQADAKVTVGSIDRVQSKEGVEVVSSVETTHTILLDSRNNAPRGSVFCRAGMQLCEIKAAVESGETVHWKHEGYVVRKDNIGQWHIVCLQNNNCIGLTWMDGETMNGDPMDFFVG